VSARVQQLPQVSFGSMEETWAWKNWKILLEKNNLSHRVRDEREPKEKRVQYRLWRRSFLPRHNQKRDEEGTTVPRLVWVLLDLGLSPVDRARCPRKLGACGASEPEGAPLLLGHFTSGIHVGILEDNWREYPTRTGREPFQTVFVASGNVSVA
jgi:hypothetical protein